MGLFSFVYIFRNLLFTGKQKNVTNFLMARIKAFEVPNISSFKNFKRKQKTASFSFVYFWLDFLFTGKQKKILKVLMAQIKVFWSFQHVLTLKKFSESKNKVRNRLYFLLFTFLLITRLKPNEKHYVMKISKFIVFS